mgnify:CR=1 FL=1
MNQEIQEKIVRLRHELHAHPELSMEERETKKRLMDFLSEHTSLKIEDRGRFFYAVYEGRKDGTGHSGHGEPIAFRADMDALPMEEKAGLPYGSQNPGVCHKCGHDGHSAALCGLALEVDRLGAERPVYFIFQHGEEIGGGGEECSRLLTEKGIRQVFAFHNMSGYPEKTVVVKSGIIQCTSKGLTVEMEGTPAHASQPEDGKNPAAALSRLALEVEALAGSNQKWPEFDGFLLATIVELSVGSRNFGIAASRGSLSVTLRADYERDLERLDEMIREQAQKLALEYGLSVSFHEQDFFPETVNDEEAAGRVRKAAAALGLPVTGLPRPFRGSEDFGYYLKRCPGAIFYIGNGTDYPQLHTMDYDFNDQILETAVDLFLELLRV